MKTLLPLLALLALALGCAQSSESTLEPASPSASRASTETRATTTPAESDASEAAAKAEAETPTGGPGPAVAAESTATPAERPSLVRTVEGLDEGRRIARAEGKTIVLKFEASWCAPCKLMTREGFVDMEVAERLKDTIVVKVDIDEEKNEALAQKYQVASVPFLVFLDKDEKPFDAIKGYEDVPWFRARLAQVLGKRRV